MLREFAEFRDLVKRMRRYQKLYFKNRAWDDLETSKKLERQVDRLITKLEVDEKNELARNGFFFS